MLALVSISEELKRSSTVSSEPQLIAYAADTNVRQGPKMLRQTSFSTRDLFFSQSVSFQQCFPVIETY